MINMSVTSRIIKNSGLLVIASLINNVMTFILTLFTARYLGTYDFGLISSATSLVGVFGVLCDLGLSTYAVREVSRNPDKCAEYFGTTYLFRIIFSLVSVSLYVIFVYMSNFSQKAFTVMMIFGVYLLFNSLAFFYYSLFQSNEKMHYQTIGNVIYSVSVLIIILIMIFNKTDVILVSAGYPIAMFLSFAYCAYIAHKHYPKFKIKLEKSFVVELFKKGIPFSITAVFTSIYFWIALILLTYMSTSNEVGLFSSSQKLLLVLSALFALLSNAIFPVMSQLYSTDKEKLADLYKKLMKYILVMGVAIAVGTSIYSEEIIAIVYGSQYVVGSLSLTILIWAGVFMFITSIISTLLGAINKQYIVTKITIITVIISFIINYVFILYNSYIGASYATVLTEVILVILMLIPLRNTEFNISLKETVKPVVQVIISNIIMAVVLIYLGLPFILAVPIAVVVYVIALLITGTINKEDREIIMGFVKSVKK